MSRLVTFVLLASPLAGCTPDAGAPVVDSDGADVVGDTDRRSDIDLPVDTDDTDPLDSDAHTDAPTDALVPNGSFDAPALEPGGRAWTTDGADPADGWSFDGSTSTGGSAGVGRPDAAAFADVEPLAGPAEGAQALWLQTDLPGALRTVAPTAVIASLRSHPVATVAPSTTYTIRAAFGRAVGSSLPDHVVVSLVADRTTIRTVEVDPETIPEGGWVEQAITWRSTASLHGKELRVGLTATTTFTAEGSAEVWVDAVRIGAD